MELRKKIREEVISARILAKTVDEAVDSILLLFDVVGQSEQLPCEHPYHSIIGEEHGNPKCLKCGKNI